MGIDDGLGGGEGSDRPESLRTPSVELTGHTGVVVAADWITGGDQVITASWDRSANLYDVETGELVQCLTGNFSNFQHQNSIIIFYHYCFRSRSRIDSCFCSQYPKISRDCFPWYDIPSMGLPRTNSFCIRVPGAHRVCYFILIHITFKHIILIKRCRSVTSAVFTKDDKVVSGSDDRSVKVTFQIHKTIYTSLFYNKFQVWDLRNMRSSLSTINSSSSVNRIAVSSGGVIAIPHDNRQIRFFDLQGQRMGKLPQSNRTVRNFRWTHKRLWCLWSCFVFRGTGAWWLRWRGRGIYWTPSIFSLAASTDASSDGRSNRPKRLNFFEFLYIWAHVYQYLIIFVCILRYVLY